MTPLLGTSSRVYRHARRGLSDRFTAWPTLPTHDSASRHRHSISTDTATVRTRTHVARFDDFVDDLGGDGRSACRYPRLPLFLWGHSMGSIVASLAARAGRCSLRGVVTSSNSLEIFRRGAESAEPFLSYRFAGSCRACVSRSAWTDEDLHRRSGAACLRDRPAHSADGQFAAHRRICWSLRALPRRSPGRSGSRGWSCTAKTTRSRRRQPLVGSA